MHSKRKVHFAQIANVLLENSASRKIAEGGGVGVKSCNDYTDNFYGMCMNNASFWFFNCPIWSYIDEVMNF